MGRSAGLGGVALALISAGCVDVAAQGEDRLAAIEGRLATLEARLTALESGAASSAPVAPKADLGPTRQEIVAIRNLRLSDHAIQTFAGEIIAIIEGYKLRIRDATGVVLVDAGREGVLPQGFSPAIGDRVTITGVNDDLIDFDANLIMTPDGRSFRIDRRGEWE